MTKEEQRAALGELVVLQAGHDRSAIPDSDLDDEQSVIVTVTTTLGALRKAGVGNVTGYYPEET